ncbi:Lipoprotein [Fusobacterium sp. oral taxon C10]
MKIKLMLLSSFVVLSLIACTNTSNQTNEERDGFQILEEKREFYEKRDKKIAREKQGYQENMTAEEAKLEKEKMANMTEDEKLSYKVDKAKEKIDNMLDIAKKARQEEIDVEEAKKTVEAALKSVTEDTQEE